MTFVSYEGPFLCVGCTNIVKGFKSPSVGFTVRFKYVRVAFGFQRMSQWRKAGEKTVLPSVSRRVIPFLLLWRVLLHLVWLPVYVKSFYSPFIQFHPTAHTSSREQPRERSSALWRDHGKKQSRRERKCQESELFKSENEEKYYLVHLRTSLTTLFHNLKNGPLW